MSQLDALVSACLNQSAAWLASPERSEQELHRCINLITEGISGTVPAVWTRGQPHQRGFTPEAERTMAAIATNQALAFEDAASLARTLLPLVNSLRGPRETKQAIALMQGLLANPNYPFWKLERPQNVIEAYAIQIVSMEAPNFHLAASLSLNNREITLRLLALAEEEGRLITYQRERLHGTLYQHALETLRKVLDAHASGGLPLPPTWGAVDSLLSDCKGSLSSQSSACVSLIDVELTQLVPALDFDLPTKAPHLYAMLHRESGVDWPRLPTPTEVT